MGEGALTVVHEDGPRKFSVLENVPTQKGARTMEVDPKTHTVFLITADRTPTPPTSDNSRPRPTTTPGTFRLLVYAR